MTSDNTYTGKVVRLSELVATDGVLDGFVFTGCQINGPAVLVLDDSIFAHNRLRGPTPDAIMWEIPPSRPVIVGAIVARKCTFERCTFEGIGFAGPPDFIRHLRDGQ